MKYVFRLAIMALVLSSTCYAETELRQSRKKVTDSITFNDYGSYLENITINAHLKCYKRYGTNAGKLFYKKFLILDNEISGNPEVYGDNRYVSGQFSYRGRASKSRASGKVSFTGKLTGSDPYIQTFIKARYQQYTCYNLVKFDNNG